MSILQIINTWQLHATLDICILIILFQDLLKHLARSTANIHYKQIESEVTSKNNNETEVEAADNKHEKVNKIENEHQVDKRDYSHCNDDDNCNDNDDESSDNDLEIVILFFCTVVIGFIIYVYLRD